MSVAVGGQENDSVSRSCRKVLGFEGRKIGVQGNKRSLVKKQTSEEGGIVSLQKQSGDSSNGELLEEGIKW